MPTAEEADVRLRHWATEQAAIAPSLTKEQATLIARLLDTHEEVPQPKAS